MYTVIRPAVRVLCAVSRGLEAALRAGELLAGGVTAGADLSQVVVLPNGDLLPEGRLGVLPQPVELVVAGLGVLLHLVDPRKSLRQDNSLHRGEGGRGRGHVKHVSRRHQGRLWCFTAMHRGSLDPYKT